MSIIKPPPISSVMNFMLQNGGSFSSTETQIATGSPRDTHSGTVGSSDVQKRPKNLEMNLGISSKALIQKNLRETSADIEDSSLPSTPECDDVDEGDSSAEMEALEHETRTLICTFLRIYTGLGKSHWNDSKPLATMKRVVNGLLEKHSIAYNGMINKLSLEDRGDDMTFVTSVAKSMFADKISNWGRIASLVAFGAVVSQYLKKNGRGHCVELVGQEVSSYLLSDQRDWLIKNNSWDGFVEFFRESDPESTVRTTLMAFAGVAGIGATLALLIR